MRTGKTQFRLFTFVCITLAIALNLNPASAQPIEVWVDDGYCNVCANDGHTWGSDAFSKIQDGIDAVASLGIVNVAAGHYMENITLKDGVLVLGAGADITIIDAQNDGSVVTAVDIGSESVLEGFTITKGMGTPRGSYTYGGAIYVLNSSIIVRKSIIVENRGTDGAGGIEAYDSTIRLYNNEISQNRGWWGGAVSLYRSNAEIVANIIDQNGCGYGGAIFLDDSTQATIVNNLITSGCSPAIRIGESSNADIMNNTIADNGGTGIVTKTDYVGNGIGSATITNCILWGNHDDLVNLSATYSNIQDADPGEGNISEDPMFADPENGNYHLPDYSSCIGAGTPHGAPSSDIEGNPRPYPPGSNPDIGAYENALEIPIIPPPIIPPPGAFLDTFGLEVGNKWTYQGTYMGTTPYTWESEVVTVDHTTFPTTTYIIDYKQDGVRAYKFWYEKTANELKRWGEESNDDKITYSKGLVEAWYPMKVNDHEKSSASINLNGYEFNISLTVDVLSKEPVALSFGTLEAYKVRKKFRIWGYDQEEISKYYEWVVPYLGILKYQDSPFLELLTAFTIDAGMITQDTDVDSDGLKDYEEFIVYNTNWQKPDTDNDGLSDGDEVDTHNTYPNDSDSDDDGLSDGDEINTYETDPNNEDSDNDGLSDFDEINIHDSDPNNEDTDGDELSDGDEIDIGTDPINPDTDEDGMSDGWEDTHDLNPLVDDAADDPDGDGLTNLQEYNLGRHPTNVEPDKPVLLLPDDNATDILLTAELQTQSFTDTDDDFHAQSQWQIGKQIDNPQPCPEESFTNSDYIVFDATSDTQLTLFSVPDLLLDLGTNYCWRARFTDTGNATSDWADPFSFSTIALSEDDQDPPNGIPDDQEADCLGIFDPGEIPPNTVCVDTLVGNAQVGIEASTNVTSIQAFRSVDPQTIPENLQGVKLPIGLMSFKAEVDQVGDIIELTFHSSEPMPEAVKCYKYDPINGWQDYSAHVVSISPDRKSITIEYKDGDFGDLDGVANKLVIDPVGFGVANADDGGGGGGGGGGGSCFIDTLRY